MLIKSNGFQQLQGIKGVDDIIKMAPELRTQGMQFYQAIIRRFGSIIPADCFPANALFIQKLEGWLKKVNK